MGAQTESSAFVDGSPPLFLRFQFSPASTTLCAHALCAAGPEGSEESWVHHALFHQVVRGKEGATVHPCLVTASRFHMGIS